MLDTKHSEKETTRRHSCVCGARWNSAARVISGSVVRPLIPLPIPISGGGQPPLEEAPISGGGISFSDPDLLSGPGSNPSSKLTNRFHNKMRAQYSAAFEAAWDLYPRRDEKAMAYAQWKYCAKDIGEDNLAALVIAALQWQVPLLWAGPNWRFAKYFARYLKAKKWEDERPVPANGHDPYRRLDAPRNFREEATADAFARARAARREP